MNRWFKTKLVVVSVLAASVVGAIGPSTASAAGGPIYAKPASSAPAPAINTLTESQLYQLIEKTPKKIDSVTIENGTDTVVVIENGAAYQVAIANGTESSLTQQLLKAGVKFDSDNSNLPKPAGASHGSIMSTISSLVWLILLGFLVFALVRHFKGQNAQMNRMGGLTKSGAKKFTGGVSNIRFKDVAGQEEAKEELAEIVEFLKNPGKFRALGAKIPRGALLIGPPGNGKTLLARAVAGEAGAEFFSISGSNFVEMFVGVGAARVRDLFKEAKAHAPAIIFMDEIDGVGRQRGAGHGGGHDEREQTLNQLLVEMDGFEDKDNIIVLAATNRPDILDPALIRPGRFDRQVLVERPDRDGRLAILKVHTKGKPLAEDVNLDTIAGLTPGMSGADLANVANEASILAARRGRQTIGMDELDEGIARTSLGVARNSRSKIMTPELKKKIAYHEAGHAVVSHRLGQRIGKITIMPRSRALGYAQKMPDDNEFVMSREQLFADIAMALAGRAADERFSDLIHTGASNDFKQAYTMARRMVTEFGMSGLGPISVGGDGSDPFMGRQLGSAHDGIGPDLANQIDLATKEILAEADARARSILERENEAVESLVAVLLEKETVLADEFVSIVGI